jgi:hypothetical protein
VQGIIADENTAGRQPEAGVLLQVERMGGGKGAEGGERGHTCLTKLSSSAACHGLRE